MIIVIDKKVENKIDIMLVPEFPKNNLPFRLKTK